MEINGFSVINNCCDPGSYTVSTTVQVDWDVVISNGSLVSVVSMLGSGPFTQWLVIGHTCALSLSTQPLNWAHQQFKVTV